MKLRGILALALMLGCAPALAQVTPGTSPLTGPKGGTNNAFMQFVGPASSLKTFTVPNANSTLAALGAIQTWTAAQSFTDGTLILLGSGSGSSIIKAPATGGGTATLFPGTDTIVGTAASQSLSNKMLVAPVLGVATGTSLAVGTGLSLSQTIFLSAGSNSATSSLDVGQDSTHLLAVNWLWNVTPASASAQIATFSFANPLTIDASNVSIQGASGGTLSLLGKTVALGGNFAMSGAFGFTGTLTGTTAVTFPTSGTLVAQGGPLGTPSSGVATNITGLPASTGITGQVPIANGGTAQATAVAARQASGLNVYGDAGTAHGDAGVTLGNTERFSYTNAAFTASRAWVLPAANVTGAPYTIKIADLAGGVTGTNTLVITRAGADTINGGTTATISAANGGYECSSDGSSKWSCLSMGPASGGGVTSVTCGTTTVTTSGTCAYPYFSAYPSVASTTVTTSASTKMNINTKVSDSNTWFDAVTNFRFTPLLAGKYLVHVQVTCNGTTVSACVAQIMKNGSNYAQQQINGSVSTQGANATAIVTMNGSTDFLEANVLNVCTGTCGYTGGTAPEQSLFEANLISP